MENINRECPLEAQGRADAGHALYNDSTRPVALWAMM